LWIDATYVKVRQAGRIVSVAVIVAVGVNADGRREVLGMDIGQSEAETFWTAFLRKLSRRGLRGVKLVVSDAHEGIKAAVSRIFTATWQRCRVHFMRKVSIPTRQAGCLAKNATSSLRASRRRSTVCPAASTPWTWKTDLARSRPIETTDIAETPFEAEDTHAPISQGSMGVVHAIKWAVQRARYITLESIAPVGDDLIVSLPVVAA